MQSSKKPVGPKRNRLITKDKGQSELVEPPLRIGSFNLQKFGQNEAYKSVDVSETLAHILKRYDLLLIMEPRTSAETNIDRLIKRLNTVDRQNPFDFEESEANCRIHGLQEHYCFFYRISKLSVVDVHRYGQDPFSTTGWRKGNNRPNRQQEPAKSTTGSAGVHSDIINKNVPPQAKPLPFHSHTHHKETPRGDGSGRATEQQFQSSSARDETRETLASKSVSNTTSTSEPATDEIIRSDSTESAALSYKNFEVGYVIADELLSVSSNEQSGKDGPQGSAGPGKTCEKPQSLELKGDSAQGQDLKNQAEDDDEDYWQTHQIGLRKSISVLDLHEDLLHEELLPMTSLYEEESDETNEKHDNTGLPSERMELNKDTGKKPSRVFHKVRNVKHQGSRSALKKFTAQRSSSISQNLQTSSFRPSSHFVNEQTADEALQKDDEDQEHVEIGVRKSVSTIDFVEVSYHFDDIPYMPGLEEEPSSEEDQPKEGHGRLLSRYTSDDILSKTDEKDEDENYVEIGVRKSVSVFDLVETSYQSDDIPHLPGLEEVPDLESSEDEAKKDEKKEITSGRLVSRFIVEPVTGIENYNEDEDYVEIGIKKSVSSVDLVEGSHTGDILQLPEVEEERSFELEEDEHEKGQGTESGQGRLISRFTSEMVTDLISKNTEKDDRYEDCVEIGIRKSHSSFDLVETSNPFDDTLHLPGLEEEQSLELEDEKEQGAESGSGRLISRFTSETINDIISKNTAKDDKQVEIGIRKSVSAIDLVEASCHFDAISHMPKLEEKLSSESEEDEPNNIVSHYVNESQFQTATQSTSPKDKDNSAHTWEETVHGVKHTADELENQSEIIVATLSGPSPPPDQDFRVSRQESQTVIPVIFSFSELPISSNQTPGTGPIHTNQISEDPGTGPIHTNQISEDPGTGPIHTNQISEDPGTGPIHTNQISEDPGTGPIHTNQISEDIVEDEVGMARDKNQQNNPTPEQSESDESNEDEDEDSEEEEEESDADESSVDQPPTGIIKSKHSKSKNPHKSIRFNKRASVMLTPNRFQQISIHEMKQVPKIRFCCCDIPIARTSIFQRQYTQKLKAEAPIVPASAGADSEKKEEKKEEKNEEEEEEEGEKKNEKEKKKSAKGENQNAHTSICKVNRPHVPSTSWVSETEGRCIENSQKPQGVSEAEESSDVDTHTLHHRNSCPLLRGTHIHHKVTASIKLKCPVDDESTDTNDVGKKIVGECFPGKKDINKNKIACSASCSNQRTKSSLEVGLTTSAKALSRNGLEEQMHLHEHLDQHRTGTELLPERFPFREPAIQISPNTNTQHSQVPYNMQVIETKSSNSITDRVHFYAENNDENSSLDSEGATTKYRNAHMHIRNHAIQTETVDKFGNNDAKNWSNDTKSVEHKVLKTGKSCTQSQAATAFESCGTTQKRTVENCESSQFKKILQAMETFERSSWSENQTSESLRRNRCSEKQTAEALKWHIHMEDQGNEAKEKDINLENEAPDFKDRHISTGAEVTNENTRTNDQDAEATEKHKETEDISNLSKDKETKSQVAADKEMSRGIENQVVETKYKSAWTESLNAEPVSRNKRIENPDANIDIVERQTRNEVAEVKDMDTRTENQAADVTNENGQIKNPKQSDVTNENGQIKNPKQSDVTNENGQIKNPKQSDVTNENGQIKNPKQSDVTNENGQIKNPKQSDVTNENGQIKNPKQSDVTNENGQIKNPKQSDVTNENGQIKNPKQSDDKNTQTENQSAKAKDKSKQTESQATKTRNKNIKTGKQDAKLKEGEIGAKDQGSKGKENNSMTEISETEHENALTNNQIAKSDYENSGTANKTHMARNIETVKIGNKSTTVADWRTTTENQNTNADVEKTRQLPEDSEKNGRSFPADDLKLVFCREPFAVHFLSPLTEVTQFAVVALHTDPSDALKEVRAIQRIYDVTSAKWHLEDILLVGDFSMDESERQLTHWRAVEIKSDRRFTHMMHMSDAGSPVPGAKERNYDRFVVAGRHFNRAFISSAVGFYRFDVALNLTVEQAAQVSDHYPIEIQIAGHATTRWQKYVKTKVGVIIEQVQPLLPSPALRQLCKSTQGTRSSAHFRTEVLYEEASKKKTEVRATQIGVTDVVQCLKEFQLAYPDILKDTTLSVAASFLSSPWVTSSPVQGLKFHNDVRYDVMVTVTLQEPLLCHVRILRQLCDGFSNEDKVAVREG